MDENAVADAYRRFAPAVFAHCRRLLASPVLARDAAQEVFVKVLASRRGLPSGDEGLRYLYRVATNHCLNQLRDARVRRRATDDLQARAGDGGAEPAYAERQLIEKLLAHAPVRDLEIAVLHWIDGMTQVEVATTLGMSRRGVYSRLRRIEALALALGQTPPGTADATGTAATDDGDQAQPPASALARSGDVR